MEAPTPTEEQPLDESLPEPPRRSHARRPPLAEIDSWELWQEWKQGERLKALPWIGLLAGFCVLLAGMYSFFFFSTSISDDTIAQIGLTIVFIAFLFSLWRRISPRRDFALVVVALILAASGLLFVLWLLAYRLSGWNSTVAVIGTLALGLIGLVVGISSINAISRQQQSNEQ